MTLAGKHTGFVFWGLLLSLLLGACTTVPVDKKPAPVQQDHEQLQQLFLQGKQLFLQKKYDEAAALFLPLARQGHLDAQYALGYMYHYGFGVPRNEKEALRWITTAAARGHHKAQEALKILDTQEQHTSPQAPAITAPLESQSPPAATPETGQ